MRKYWFFGLLILSLLLSACSSAAPTAAPIAASVEPVSPTKVEPPTAIPQEQPTETAAPTVAEPTKAPVIDGKVILESRCVSCHTLAMVREAKYDDPNMWRTTVEDMINRGAPLNDEQKELLIAYLIQEYPGKGVAPSQPATGDSPSATEESLNDLQKLGMTIFFDKNLSVNRNQACAACHGPEVGFTGPDQEINKAGGVYEGSIPGAFGNRKPPSAAYATYSPILALKDGAWFGGNFFDGRATGEKLGNPAADQAQGPFLNLKEQALPEGACVVYRICSSDYKDAFTKEYPGACDIDWPSDADDSCAAGELIAIDEINRKKAEAAYDSVALAIKAYESSSAVNQFSSKFDLVQQGLTEFSAEEQLGLELFQGRGQCTICHTSTGDKPLFTDFSYHNLGAPKNPENPVYEYDPNFIDTGLGGYLQSIGEDEAVYKPEWGKVKTATLRNVNKRSAENIIKAHMHNGFFKSLYGIIHFYNTRSTAPVCPADYTENQALQEKCWPAPEVAENMDIQFMGDLGLTFEEEMALVAFLKTLDDGFVP